MNQDQQQKHKNFDAQRHKNFDAQRHLSQSLEESSLLAKAWLDYIEHTPSLILLQGPVGAGKSCFVKYCLEHLNLLQTEQDFCSPSYSLVNEYPAQKEVPDYSSSLTAVYHIDFYRLHNETEVLELDIIKDKNSMYFFEWPERVEASFFDTFDIKIYTIRFEIVDETRRYLFFTQKER